MKLLHKLWGMGMLRARYRFQIFPSLRESPSEAGNHTLVLVLIFITVLAHNHVGMEKACTEKMGICKKDAAGQGRRLRTPARMDAGVYYESRE